ncbi:MAG TPA: efflux transporter outer membrane subunit [Rugosibacter sp.]
MRSLNFSLPQILCLSSLLLAISGCAIIPPDHDALPRQDLASAQLAADIKLAHDNWPQAQWWKGYGDAQLDRLMAQALQNSPSLQMTAARIGSAQAALNLDAADEGVDVNFKTEINRQRYSANGFFPAPIGGNYYTESTLKVLASHDFDWWGKRRAQIAAALGEVNARHAEHAQAEQTLAAAVAQSYFNWQAQWARLDKLQQRCVKQEELVADKVKRIAHGIASIDEQQTAEAELNHLHREQAALDAQLGREREALRSLLGANSHALIDLAPQPLSDIPHALPSTLGIELLARRPDLQVARWRVEASLNRIEADQAAFYPEVNLTGFIGLDSVSMSDLFNASSRTLFIGPALSLPLFDSRRLQARLGLARTQRNELIADYNQLVFNAVRDVAQEGLTLRGMEVQIREQTAATKMTDALLRSVRARFTQGLVDRSTLLNAELAALKEQDISLQVKNQQLLSEVALIKTLGGGYRAEPPMGNKIENKTEKNSANTAFRK